MEIYEEEKEEEEVVMESYEEQDEDAVRASFQKKRQQDEVEVVVDRLHPAAVSQERVAFIKNMIFAKLCVKSLGGAIRDELFTLYYEVDSCRFLLGHRYNQIFIHVTSLNTN